MNWQFSFCFHILILDIDQPMGWGHLLPSFPLPFSSNIAVKVMFPLDLFAFIAKLYGTLLKENPSLTKTYQLIGPRS